MMPERVASMVIVVLATPPDIVVSKIFEMITVCSREIIILPLEFMNKHILILCNNYNPFYEIEYNTIQISDYTFFVF